MRRLGAWGVLASAALLVGGGVTALETHSRHGAPVWELARVAMQGGTLLDRATEYRQRERLDCGVAVATYVLARFASPVSREVVESRLPRVRGGVRFEHLAAMLREYGMNARLRRFAETASRRPESASRWPEPPAILWLPPGHFVVLEAADVGSVVVFDPALGRVRYPAGRFARRWTGAALCLSPTTGGRS